MKTASTSIVTFLNFCIVLTVLEQSALAVHLNQALLGHVTVLAGCGCAESPIVGDSYGGDVGEDMNYSLGYGNGCYACGGGMGGRGSVLGQVLHGMTGGKVYALISQAKPVKWLNTPSDTGLHSWFNCGCNGSYKFPVPPLSTYHWAGMFSHQLMTDYQSPWRFPAVRPFGKEHDPKSCEFLPPTDAEPIPSAEHAPVSYQEEPSAAEPVDDVRRMSEVMASLYGE